MTDSSSSSSSASSAAAVSSSSSAPPSSAHSFVAFSPSHLSLYDTILFDCDGVLWSESSTTPGAPALLSRLHRCGKKIIFVTNNSGSTRSDYVAKLGKLGFDTVGMNIVDDDIITSAQVAADYVANVLTRKRIDAASPSSSTSSSSTPSSSSSSSSPVFDPSTHAVLTVGSSAIAYELGTHSIRSIDTRVLIGAGHISRHMLASMPIDPSVRVVIVGIDDELTYTKVAIASIYLSQLIDADGDPHSSSNKLVTFISTNQDSTLPTAGHTLPGAGSCVSMVSAACGRPVDANMGKPSRAMFATLLRLHPSIVPVRTLMVGDRLDTDILFGRDNGIDTLLVTATGINDEADCTRTSVYPTYVATDVTKMMDQEAE